MTTSKVHPKYGELARSHMSMLEQMISSGGSQVYEARQLLDKAKADYRRTPCPVCQDWACETKTDQCGR